MQRPDEAKRWKILTAAARLFGSRPYHGTRLEDIAAAVRVGKGTASISFRNRESLYMVLIREGFEQVVAAIRSDLAGSAAGTCDRLERVARGLIEFATGFSGTQPQRTRRELTDFIEGIIRDRNEPGELADPRPTEMAQFLLSFVRGALLDSPPELTADVLRACIMRVLRHGIGTGAAA